MRLPDGQAAALGPLPPDAYKVQFRRRTFLSNGTRLTQSLSAEDCVFVDDAGVTRSRGALCPGPEAEVWIQGTFRDDVYEPVAYTRPDNACCGC